MAGLTWSNIVTQDFMKSYAVRSYQVRGTTDKLQINSDYLGALSDDITLVADDCCSGSGNIPSL